MIDWSDEDENAFDSIRVNREFDSSELTRVTHNLKNMKNQKFEPGINVHELALLLSYFISFHL
jgi:hypothetical protein